jgi:putative intracellular protease/amidase
VAKYLSIYLMLIPAFFSLNETNIYAESNPKVLLFIHNITDPPNLELILIEEVGVMKQKLEQSGFEVAVVTLSGEPISAGSTSIKPNLKLADVEVVDYEGFILPCFPTMTVSPEAVKEEKPVAALRASVAILASAGVLKDKKYAYKRDSSEPDFRGAIYSGKGVVRDGNIITAGICANAATYYGLQNGTEELTKTLIEAVRGKTEAKE